ncbi:ABC transporter permease subunit [Nonomuraea wenchangensis]|uniref:ABC transporter permease subunit n=1 Tax=Nonomuraea wenchangensis TaxID=568860 RepID=UPI0033D6E350
MTATAPYRSPLGTAGRDGFARLVHAEWTKFRTVRGGPAGLVLAALLVVGLGLLSAAGSHASCSKGPVEVPCPVPPRGPGGEAVEDHFFFAHQPLRGDGSITVRVSAMSGRIRLPDAVPGVRNVATAMTPWARAGLMIKASTRQGASYAAVMVTAEHGVRMQHDFTEDVAGLPGKVTPSTPRWLRLTRAGDTVTGEESADGVRWTKVAAVRLPGLPAQARVGLFAASPGDVRVSGNAVGGSTVTSRFAEVTAVMDRLGVRGAGTGGAFALDDIGVAYELDGSPHHPGGFRESGGTYTITGVGDIAPLTVGSTVENTLAGAMFALVAVIVVGVLSVTAEYRRGLVRTTLLASPRRGRVLVAKAAVVLAATFAGSLAATAVTLPLARHVLAGNGVHLLPVSALTELRVVAGVAGVLAVSAVLALAFGALLRRGAAAVIAAVAAVLVPYVLATTSVLPEPVADWLLRVTPAAGFAVQQSIPEYPQVVGHHAPAGGFYPLPPWAGFAVLCGYAALVLALAVRRLNREDA